MNAASKRGPYPWGRASPGMRLRATAERAKKELEQAKVPGLAQVQHRWTESVRAALPLVEALDHLSRAGFRGARDQERLSGADIANATRAIHDALGEFVESSVVNLSERYASFTTAAERLIALAEEAGRRGVESDRDVRVDDPWKAFKD